MSGNTHKHCNHTDIGTFGNNRSHLTIGTPIRMLINVTVVNAGTLVAVIINVTIVRLHQAAESKE